MALLEFNLDKVTEITKSFYKSDSIAVIDFMESLLDPNEKEKLPATLKTAGGRTAAPAGTLNQFINKKIKDQTFREAFSAKLTSTENSKEIYYKLIWEDDRIPTDFLPETIPLPQNIPDQSYGVHEVVLADELSLISYFTRSGDYFTKKYSFVKINPKIVALLKFLFPLPLDYELVAIENSAETEYTYNNEEGILGFITLIDEMIEHNLVEISETNEKTSTKTLNVLKKSSGIPEFYGDKGMDSYANDMLTRSFFFFRFAKKSYRNKELESLKEFVQYQLENRLQFFISRIFTSHLRKVRFSQNDTSQAGLFLLLKEILMKMPKEAWVSFENIEHYCFYRKYEIHLEARHKTDSYNMECQTEMDKFRTFSCEEAYHELFLNPLLKASLFYLGALGVLEIKYEHPLSECGFSAEGKDYISVWDGLSSIRFTQLGKYLLGFTKEYTPKVLEREKREIKFDEYKPIMTINLSDTITIAKLEGYAEKIDANKYALSYPKIFKECTSFKALDLKITAFYKNIEEHPPKVFVDFFEEIRNRANLLSVDRKQIVIELENDKALLHLFMNNKKLQELIIKAQGYRILVLKENLPKVKKILHDNGFFIDF
ncbi:MAG: hypothetical protein NTY39_08005 [Campylobacterales bacterium]|nr:hypothetical protein [Campylobacterales bacterium]